MLQDIIHGLAALGGLSAGAVMLAHVKSKGSSVLLHHATHGRLHPDRRLNRLLGEAAGIVSLSIGFVPYRQIHGKHHGYPSFAQPGLDSEADELIALGFHACRSKRELWRLFWSVPLSPLWQLRAAWNRLEANFLRGHPLRRLAAGVFWGGAGGAAAAVGWLPAFAGAVTVLLVAGNVGSYLELVSRHAWGITPPEVGRDRQLALSRWRLPSPELPQRWTPASALTFAGDVLLQAVVRFGALQADLTHHAGHHLAWDAGGDPRQPAWADAALAYSDRLRADPALRAHVYGSLQEAVDAWFDALERAPTSAR